MSPLDKIIDYIQSEEAARDVSKQKIKDLFLELIGPDDDAVGNAKKAWFNKGGVLRFWMGHNQVRRAFRQKVSEL